MNLSNFNFQQYKSLSVLQFSTDNPDTLDYVSGSNAILEKKVIVSEVSESGNVNTLMVDNLLDKMIFFSDSDILSGAKQNRVLNVSILLDSKSKTLVPVSCIERGRWSYRSKNFSGVDYHAYTDLRAKKAKAVTKNLKKGYKFLADQGEIWQEVTDKYNDFCDYSPTDNLSDLYDKRSNDIGKFLEQFIINNESDGVAFFIHDKLQSIDIFGRKDIYRLNFTKLLKGMGLSCLNMITKNELMLKMEQAVAKTDSVLSGLSNYPEEKYDSVGLGCVKRFDDDNITGFNLSFNNNLVHLALLNFKK